MLSPITKLRMMINDEDVRDKLFADDELNDILTKNSYFIETYVVTSSSLEKIFKVPPDMYDYKIYYEDSEGVLTEVPTENITQINEGILKISLDVDKVMFRGTVYDFKEAAADCLEIIANNFRKLHQYSVSNMANNLSDVKMFLLDAAAKLRKARSVRFL